MFRLWQSGLALLCLCSSALGATFPPKFNAISSLELVETSPKLQRCNELLSLRRWNILRGRQNKARYLKNFAYFFEANIEIESYEGQKYLFNQRLAEWVLSPAAPALNEERIAILTWVSRFDPYEDFRQTAAAILQDAVAWREATLVKREKAREEQIISDARRTAERLEREEKKAAQDGLIFYSASYFGFEAPKLRIEALKRLARRALRWSNREIDFLKTVIEKDQDEKVRQIAGELLKDPIPAWFAAFFADDAFWEAEKSEIKAESLYSYRVSRMVTFNRPSGYSGASDRDSRRLAIVRALFERDIGMFSDMQVRALQYIEARKGKEISEDMVKLASQFLTTHFERGVR